MTLKLQRRIVYLVLLVFFIVGALLVAISYASRQAGAGPDLWRLIVRDLGIAMALTASVTYVVDTFFHKILLENVRGMYDELSLDLTKKMQEVEYTIQGVPAMSGCLSSGIRNIYQNRPNAERSILKDLGKAQHRVWLLGISLRTFFQGGGELNSEVKAVFRRQSQRLKDAQRQTDEEEGAGSSSPGDSRSPKDFPDWRVLLLDPTCEQAKIRSKREEPKGMPAGEATLSNEVRETVRCVRRFKNETDLVDVKLYRGAPSCAAYIIDDVIYVEQYHYGLEGGDRVAELVPLIEFSKDSSTYKQLTGHFEYMWNHLSEFPKEEDEA